MAKKTKRLSVHLTDREQVWAILYLLVCYSFLPWILNSMNSYLSTSLSSIWLNFLYYAINFLAILWIFGQFFRRSLVYAGQHIVDFLIAVIAGFFLYWLCNWGLAWVLDTCFPDYTNLNDGTIGLMAGSNYTVMFIGTVFLVPVAEEALHRGLVFGCLYPKSHAAAYILSAAVFSVVHILGYVGIYSPLHLILAFIQYLPAGLTLAWAYRKSGSIFAPMVMHAINNGIGMLAFREW